MFFHKRFYHIPVSIFAKISPNRGFPWICEAPAAPSPSPLPVAPPHPESQQSSTRSTPLFGSSKNSCHFCWLIQGSCDLLMFERWPWVSSTLSRYKISRPTLTWFWALLITSAITVSFETIQKTLTLPYHVWLYVCFRAFQCFQACRRSTSQHIK